MISEVKEFIKSLKPITNFFTLNNGDKIFNKESLSVNYIDVFDHVERWGNGELILYYYNYKGEYWWGCTEGYWYYI